MSKRSKSPCIDVCTYTGPMGWCVGCGLTRSESKGWRGMKPYDRTAILKQLKRRQVELRTLNLDAPECSD